MGTHVRFAEWHKEDGRYVVHPPGWPKDTVLSFNERKDMIEWSHNVRVVLKAKDAGRRYV